MKKNVVKAKGRKVIAAEKARSYRIPARMANDIYMFNLLGSLPRMEEILGLWKNRQMSDEDFFDEMFLLYDVQVTFHQSLYSGPLKTAIDQGAGGDIEWTEPEPGEDEWTLAELLGGRVREPVNGGPDAERKAK